MKKPRFTDPVSPFQVMCQTNVILLGGGCSLLIMGLAASLACCLRWLYLRHTAEEQNEKYVPLASV